MRGDSTRFGVAVVFAVLATGCASRAVNEERAGIAPSAAADGRDQDFIVEAACGQCQFGLPGAGCDLAVRIAGRGAFFVDGTGIDDHGDAHAADGLCNAVRQARVRGRIEGGRFVATSFELLDDGEVTR